MLFWSGCNTSSHLPIGIVFSLVFLLLSSFHTLLSSLQATLYHFFSKENTLHCLVAPFDPAVLTMWLLHSSHTSSILYMASAFYLSAFEKSFIFSLQCLIHIAGQCFSAGWSIISIHQKVVSSIPGQSTYSGCVFDPLSVLKEGKQCFSLTLMFFSHSLSLILPL